MNLVFPWYSLCGWLSHNHPVPISPSVCPTFSNITCVNCTHQPQCLFPFCALNQCHNGLLHILHTQTGLSDVPWLKALSAAFKMTDKGLGGKRAGGRGWPDSRGMGRKEGGYSGGKEVPTHLTTRILRLLLVREHHWIIGCASGSYLLFVFQISLIYRLCTFWELSTLPVQNICCFTSYILLSKFLKANTHSTYIKQTKKSERSQVIAGKTQTPLLAMFVNDCRKDTNPSAMFVSDCRKDTNSSVCYVCKCL